MPATASSIPDIYGYSDFRGFLQDFLKARKQADPAFSRRSWGADLGLNSPALLTMILRGKRVPSEETAERFGDYFRFDSRQRDYFETLVKLERAKSSPERSARYMERLRELHPKRVMKIIPYDLFAAVSQWECWALREMVQSADFKENPSWISRKLKGRISPKQAKDAIDTLLKAGMLDRDRNGRLVPADADIGTLADQGKEAVKRFHEQMIDITKESVRSVAVEKREISGSTFNIDPADLPTLKEELRKARKEIYRRFEKPGGTATYQLSVHLVPLTEE